MRKDDRRNKYVNQIEEIRYSFYYKRKGRV